MNGEPNPDNLFLFMSAIMTLVFWEV